MHRVSVLRTFSLLIIYLDMEKEEEKEEEEEEEEEEDGMMVIKGRGETDTNYLEQWQDTYNLVKPLAWESLKLNVWESTWQLLSSPKIMGPSRPGHTSQFRLHKKQFTHKAINLHTYSGRVIVYLLTQACLSILYSCGCSGYCPLT